jgi:hypothetical protein
VIVAPALAEYENGFESWLNKMAILAQELSIPIIMYCNDATEKAVEKTFKKAKLTASISMNRFMEWEDFLVLSRDINEDDFFVLISARKGATSYTSVLENLPNKLEKHFTANTRFVIYPQQYIDNLSSDQYDDISTEPLNKGIEAVQKIGKGIGSFFKNKNNE